MPDTTAAPDRLSEQDIVARLARRWADAPIPSSLRTDLGDAAGEVRRLRAEKAELLRALRRLKREHETVVIRAVELLRENGCDCDSAEKMLEGSRPFQDARALHARMRSGDES